MAIHAPRKKFFIKITGDLADDREDVLEWIGQRAKEAFTVVCIGGGTRISEACAKHNIPYRFGPLGREIENFEGTQIARDELELNQRAMQDMLAARGIFVAVEIPVRMIASVLCHENGDTMVKSAYHGFDTLFVLTLEGREQNKRKEFANLPKVEIVAFPRLASTSPNAL